MAEANSGIPELYIERNISKLSSQLNLTTHLWKLLIANDVFTFWERRKIEASSTDKEDQAFEFFYMLTSKSREQYKTFFKCLSQSGNDSLKNLLSDQTTNIDPPKRKTKHCSSIEIAINAYRLQLNEFLNAEKEVIMTDLLSSAILDRHVGKMVRARPKDFTSDWVTSQIALGSEENFNKFIMYLKKKGKLKLAQGLNKTEILERTDDSIQKALATFYIRSYESIPITSDIGPDIEISLERIFHENNISDDQYFLKSFSDICKKMGPGASQNFRRVLLHGSTGMGKSTLVRLIALQWARGIQNPHNASLFERFRYVLLLNIDHYFSIDLTTIIMYQCGLSREESVKMKDYLLTDPDDVLLIIDPSDCLLYCDVSDLLQVVHSGVKCNIVFTLLSYTKRAWAKMEFYTGVPLEVHGFKETEALTVLSSLILLIESDNFHNFSLRASDLIGLVSQEYISPLFVVHLVSMRHHYTSNESVTKEDICLQYIEFLCRHYTAHKGYKLQCPSNSFELIKKHSDKIALAGKQLISFFEDLNADDVIVKNHDIKCNDRLLILLLSIHEKRVLINLPAFWLLYGLQKENTRLLLDRFECSNPDIIDILESLFPIRSALELPFDQLVTHEVIKWIACSKDVFKAISLLRSENIAVLLLPNAPEHTFPDMYNNITHLSDTNTGTKVMIKDFTIANVSNENFTDNINMTRNIHWSSIGIVIELHVAPGKLFITKINISYQAFPELQSFMEFINIIPDLQGLEELRVRNVNVIGVRGFFHIAKCIGNLMTLKVLDLGYTLIDSTGFQMLGKALKPLLALEVLAIPWCGCISKDAALMLNKALENAQILQELNIGGNPFCNIGIDILTERIKVLPKLTALDISFMGCYSPEPIAKLLHLLKDNDLLESLVIDGNYLGPRGIEALSKVLSPTLKHLSIAMCLCRNMYEFRVFEEFSHNSMSYSIERTTLPVLPLADQETFVLLNTENGYQSALDILVPRFQYISNLESFNVSMNPISACVFRSINDAIPNLPKLKILNVNNCRFLGNGNPLMLLKNTECVKGLEGLHMRVNSLVGLLAISTTWPYLTCLSLTNCDFDDVHQIICTQNTFTITVRMLRLHEILFIDKVSSRPCESRGHLYNIKVFSLEECSANDEQTFLHLIQSLKDTSVEEISLSRSKINYDSIMLLANILPTLHQLKRVSLSNCLDKENVNDFQLLKQLAQVKFLEKLDISYNIINLLSFEALCEVIVRAEYLAFLCLDHIQCSKNLSLRYLIKCLANKSFVREITMDGMQFMAKNDTGFIMEFPKWFTLRRICMSNMQCCDPIATSAIVWSLNLAKHLKCIHLSGITLLDDDFTVLSTGISNMSFLEELGLNNCRGNIEISYSFLAKMLKGCVHMRILLLAGYVAGEEGLKSLGETLLCFSQLRVLDVSHVIPSVKDAIFPLLNILKNCHHLHCLYIRGNSVSPNTLSKIKLSSKGMCKIYYQ